MNHPGVKSLFDRICKTNGLKPLHQDKQIEKIIESDQNLNDSLIIVDNNDNLKSPKGQSKFIADLSTQKCKLVSFKEQLKSKMKEKRQQIRKEEEEDNRMDEEYHDKIEDENVVLVEVNKKPEDENEDSDNDDFKLNLNDEEETDEEFGIRKSNSKKNSSKKSSKKNPYDFEDDEDDYDNTEEENENDEIPKEIMSTNTIPSNQLIKNPKRTQSFMNMDDLVHINNKQNTTANLSLENDDEDNDENDSNQDIEKQTEENEEVFDELAMLCSGQFKNTAKKIDAAYLSQLNQDLFSADDGEDYDLTMKNKIVDKFEVLIEENYSNSSEKSVNKKEENVIDTVITKNIELFVEEDETKNSSNSSSSNSSIKKRKIQEILDDDEEDEIEIKNIEKEKSNEDDLDNQGFFVEEAELSGSDHEGSDDDEDEEDDDSISFSGDEDQDLPSDEELKEQLGKIYLKDQLDRDKQELRLFKEMYLKDGADSELSKQNRKKQFRWKYLDKESDNNHFLFSSDDDENDEDEDDIPNELNDEQTDESKLKEKSRKFMKKLLEKKNWRTIRHEREQLLLKSKSKDLLSEDEEVNEDVEELVDIDSSNSLSKDMMFTSSNNTNSNELLKKGKQLLKQKNNNTNNNDNLANNNINKFSFLNRDKTYLNRISSYVNKNIYGSSSLKGSSTARSNLMVFSSIDINQSETNTIDDTNKKSHITSTTRSIKVTATTSNEPKRIKYNNDNCESIFNHIS